MRLGVTGRQLRNGMLALMLAAGGWALAPQARAAALTTVTITADTGEASGDISVTGAAPLTVTFTTAHDGGVIESYDWDLGGGSFSTEAEPFYTYTLPGIYTVMVTLTANGGSEMATDTIDIIVTGQGGGAITPGVSLRWAPMKSTIKLKHNKANSDSFSLNSALSFVDLPPTTNNLFAQFRINNVIVGEGLLNSEGVFSQRGIKAQARPKILFQFDQNKQTLRINIKNADLHPALAASTPPMIDETIANNAPLASDVELTLTVGVQTYRVTITYSYTSRAGSSGVAKYHSKGVKNGGPRDGMFVISKASALENKGGTGHFFEFTAVLVRPDDEDFNGPSVQPPTFMSVQIGNYTEDINADRFRTKIGQTIKMTQPQREAGGVRSLAINMKTNRVQIKTWDIPALGVGGSGMPLKGDVFVGFNLLLRVDFEPVAGSPGTFEFQAVTATRVSRRNFFDAFWQIGR